MNIIAAFLKKLLICEQELKQKSALLQHTRAVQNVHHTSPATVLDEPILCTISFLRANILFFGAIIRIMTFVINEI